MELRPRAPPRGVPVPRPRCALPRGDHEGRDRCPTRPDGIGRYTFSLIRELAASTGDPLRRLPPRQTFDRLPAPRPERPEASGEIPHTRSPNSSASACHRERPTSCTSPTSMSRHGSLVRMSSPSRLDPVDARALRDRPRRLRHRIPARGAYTPSPAAAARARTSSPGPSSRAGSSVATPRGPLASRSPATASTRAVHDLGPTPSSASASGGRSSCTSGRYPTRISPG